MKDFHSLPPALLSAWNFQTHPVHNAEKNSAQFCPPVNNSCIQVQARVQLQARLPLTYETHRGTEILCYVSLITEGQSFCLSVTDH